jgi:hypothetical protein
LRLRKEVVDLGVETGEWNPGTVKINLDKFPR